MRCALWLAPFLCAARPWRRAMYPIVVAMAPDSQIVTSTVAPDARIVAATVAPDARIGLDAWPYWQ